MRKLVSDRVSGFVDPRQKGKIEYTLHDCCQSTFAMLFFQDPSILAFQQRMEDKKQLNNLKTMFGVSKIPRSTQLRTALDEIPSAEIEALFDEFVQHPEKSRIPSGTQFRAW